VTTGDASAPILDGIRVVDLTQYLAGPTVTRLLAEQGADVVKVEQAPYGDPTRTLAVLREGRSGYFVQQNRGKRSLCVDFDDPEGRRILDALIATADVVVENYGPGVLERRGLDHASLRARHPRLIVASISGFGRAPGPLSHKTSFDLIAQAYSGLLIQTGPADGPPMPVGVSYADVMSGVHAVAGIGLALFHRERTGRGQHVDIAMVDALFHAHELTVQGAHLTGGKWRPRRSGAKSALNSPTGVFKAPQGWIVLQVMGNQWPGFCRAIGRPELEHDERFCGLRERAKNRDELNALIEHWMTGFATDADVLAVLEAERIPCAPVIDAADAHEYPYFVERRMVRTVPDPILGEVRIPGNPLRLSEQPDDLPLVAPLLGEHSVEVLAELGWTAADATRLEAAGVLRSKPR
jgi:crotonobetainyl-CoA:carnitine CoA-transferase CaiB-like acyl-CoA transferase